MAINAGISMRLAVQLIAVWLCVSATPALAQGTVDRWTAPVEAKPLPLALGGHCVVSLRDHRQWQPGVERLSAVFDGQRYQFAAVRERDVFAAAPEAYAPILGSDCPVTFAETGERIGGRLECGALQGGRLVFFADEEARRYFLEDAQRFINVDLANGGRCVVTRRTLGKDVPGIPETVATYRGLRYLFASAHDRSLFLSNPARYDGANGRGLESPPETPLSSEPIEPGNEGHATSTPWNLPPKADGKTQPLDGNEQDVILGALPAMAGYCPVTLRKEGAWVRGRYEYRVELGSLVFLTAGPKERDALASDPATFVPALGGDCVVSFVARDERVRGSVYHAFEHEGRLFLFADAERKSAFKASPAKYANADLARDGMCAVTQVDEQQDAQGVAEHATWHQGKLYRFTGAEQKQKFLAEPEKYVEK